MNATVAAAALPIVVAALVAGGRRAVRAPGRSRRIPRSQRGQRRRCHPRRLVDRLRPGQWWWAGAAAAAGGVVAGPFLGAALAVLGFGVLPRWRTVRQTRATNRAVTADLPDTIDLFVALVRAGLTPMQSASLLAQRAPPSWRPGFAAVEAARARGIRFVDALDELVVSLGSPARGMVDALSSSERYGHPIGPVLERLSDEGRAARRRYAEVEARQLPVRLSFPLVCCTLPSFVLLTIAPLLAGAFSSLQLSGGSP